MTRVTSPVTVSLQACAAQDDIMQNDSLYDHTAEQIHITHC